MANERDRKFAVGLARAVGGAVFFSLPLLMTMEMWWLGFYMDRLRLVLFILLLFPILVGLSHLSGFEDTYSWRDEVLDALVAFLVGLTVSAVILWALGLLEPGMPLDEVAGKIALQAVPGSLGAVLANSQFSAESAEAEASGRQRRASGYGAELFLMIVGALFFAFNVAPTEEMVLLAYRMTPVHTMFLLLITLLMMHGFVYGASFRGTPDVSADTPAWSLFVRFTAVGYVVALLVSTYVLWTFGRLGDDSFTAHLGEVLVLGFPAGLGAAAARLVV